MKCGPLKLTVPKIRVSCVLRFRVLFAPSKRGPQHTRKREIADSGNGELPAFSGVFWCLPRTYALKVQRQLAYMCDGSSELPVIEEPVRLAGWPASRDPQASKSEAAAAEVGRLQRVVKLNAYRCASPISEYMFVQGQQMCPASVLLETTVSRQQKCLQRRESQQGLSSSSRVVWPNQNPAPQVYRFQEALERTS